MGPTGLGGLLWVLRASAASAPAGSVIQHGWGAPAQDKKITGGKNKLKLHKSSFSVSLEGATATGFHLRTHGKDC